MKNKTHLLYGIIIGILLCACSGQTTSETSSSTGSLKEEFLREKIERFVYAEAWDYKGSPAVNEDLTKLKKDGWTIIDVHADHENGMNHYFVHVGKTASSILASSP